jgi:hypothetical protein
LSATFDNLAVPTVVYDKGGTIHYANHSYCKTFGFSSELPTRSPLAWFSVLQFFILMNLVQQLSPSSFRTYIFQHAKIFLDKENSIILPVELLNKDGKYTESMVCVSVKRDSLGLPLLFVANAIPRSVELEQSTNLGKKVQNIEHEKGFVINEARLKLREMADVNQPNDNTSVELAGTPVDLNTHDGFQQALSFLFPLQFG